MLAGASLLHNVFAQFDANNVAVVAHASDLVARNTGLYADR
jgi:hypothetical protein